MYTHVSVATCHAYARALKHAGTHVHTGLLHAWVRLFIRNACRAFTHGWIPPDDTRSGLSQQAAFDICNLTVI